jgi:iron complex outermembrane recepter protein
VEDFKLRQTLLSSKPNKIAIVKSATTKKRLLVSLLCISSFVQTVVQADSVKGYTLSVEDLLELDVSELAKIQITSVAKKAQSLNDAPAAAFVISNVDIKRSGATSIPDALRLAPGLDVARIDANKWAVSSRGFNGRFANKLQVLIDGRSTYTRTFSGVYWENQDVMMEDIDRIEVIRGSGATLWGANAVNGVVNIITKHSSKTQGGLLNVGGGTEEQGFGSFRYGTTLGKDTTARAYVKGFNRDSNTHLTGNDAGDDWDKVQGGFRMDSQLSTKDALTFQGDLYHANINQSSTYPQIAPPLVLTQNDKTRTYGGNVLGKWQHTLSPTSNYSLQLYYDTYTRNEVLHLDSRDTLDLDFQHRFTYLDWNEFVWGVNYRYGHDNLVGNKLSNGVTNFSVNPSSVNDQLISGFIQDELTLIDEKLWLTIGSKFEHNDYSGFEGQPSAKIMWAPHDQHRLWAGVSRAVRTPSRLEQNTSFISNVLPPQAPIPFPILAPVQSNPKFRSEEVISYEVGYRASFSKSVSLDVTGFYNDYRDLRIPPQGTPFINGTTVVLPFMFTNELQSKTYGIEVATVWQMLDWWRWDVNYSWLRTEFDTNKGLPRTGISPEQRVSLRGALSPWNNIDLDFWFRYVDSNFAVVTSGDTRIKPYVTLDLRVAWRPIKTVELSLVGQNLLAQQHLEYIQENQTLPTAIDRGMYGKISWGF